MNDQSFTAALTALRERTPLIHAITNPISMTQCANAILALGARPIMAEHPWEVEEITGTAAALLLNLGNITDVRMESMKLSGKIASVKNIPFTVDAVGVGCSTLRRAYAGELLAAGAPAILKGNYAEIRAFYDPAYTVSGVDGDKALTLEGTAQAASFLARQHGCIVLASGKMDLITDGNRTILVKNGTPQLGTITGTGCMLGALCSTFLAVSDPFTAAVSACVTLGVCGELAETHKGSGTFFVNLMDALSTVDGATLSTYAHTEEYVK